MTRRTVQKLVVLLVLLSLLGLAWGSGLLEHLSFQAIKAEQVRWTAWAQERPVLAAALFFVTYVIVAGASLPGATVLSLLGGALFGVARATLLVSTAATCGATIAFLVARFLLRDLVEERFAAGLGRVNAGVEREGIAYLLSLRLVPLFPFFVVNILLGPTRMTLGTYILGTYFGMLPACVLYTNAGTRLASLESASGLLSPVVIGSLVLLGLFPLVTSKLLRRLRSPVEDDPSVDPGAEA